MHFTKKIAAAFAVAIAFGASGAAASTVSLTTAVPGKYFGNEDWKTGINQTILDRGAPVGQTYNGVSGAFRFSDGVESFIAFCIDPYTYLNLG